LKGRRESGRNLKQETVPPPRGKILSVIQGG